MVTRPVDAPERKGQRRRRIAITPEHGGSCGFRGVKKQYDSANFATGSGFHSRTANGSPRPAQGGRVAATRLGLCLDDMSDESHGRTGRFYILGSPGMHRWEIEEGEGGGVWWGWR